VDFTEKNARRQTLHLAMATELSKLILAYSNDYINQHQSVRNRQEVGTEHPPQKGLEGTIPSEQGYLFFLLNTVDLYMLIIMVALP
jgi:hypothetical protein